MTNGINTISCIPWGKHEGKDVFLFRLQNGAGLDVELTNYGASLVSVVVPDKANVPGNVVLGFSSLDGYLEDTCYLGSTIGRYANRIGKARFTLNGVVYNLDQNDHDNNNHGGFRGFHSQVFDYTMHANGISFTLSSGDGEGGFPGNVQLTVHYSCNKDQELVIRYDAVTDKPTVLNFTNHAYFNLSGLRDNVLDHRLSIRGDFVLESTDAYIPTGRILPAGDQSFRQHRVRERTSVLDGNTRGLNVYYILQEKKKNNQAPDCVLTDPVSGRVLEVFTTYPGVQLYTGDYLTSRFHTHHANRYKPFDGLCLECQYYPDSPNHAHFPSTILTPGSVYREEIVYRFSVNRSTDLP